MVHVVCVVILPAQAVAETGFAVALVLLLPCARQRIEVSMIYC